MDYLYKKFADYYDLIYSFKDYTKETKFLLQLVKKYKIKNKKILEIGCGTGEHAVYLKKKGFDIVGVDLNREMLKVARRKSKSIKFLQGDMRTFNLKKRFDVVICLFSTIHYNQSYKELEKTLKNFHSHLDEGSLLIFDMGFNEERWEGGHAFTSTQSAKGVDITRFSKSRRKGNFWILDMAYILFKNNKFHFGKEEHNLRIFETLKVKKLAEKVGFKVDLFEDFTLKKWTKRSKKYVVFSCLKE